MTAEPSGNRAKRGTPGRRGLRALLGLLLVSVLSPAIAQNATGQPVEFRIRTVEAFQPGAGTDRFGLLAYRGGFEFSPSLRRLQGLSALRFTAPRGQRFLAVTDTGQWFSAELARDAQGRPIGLSEGLIAPILDAGGAPMPDKGDADAEGLAIIGDTALVAFERDHRVVQYRPPAGARLIEALFTAPAGKTLDCHIPSRELRRNQGLETLAVAPEGSALAGRLITVSEQSIDPNGNLFAAICGPRGGIFKVRRQPPWHVTDGAFLPDGDLILLERRYEGLGRIGMRLKRIAGHEIRIGALVDGPVLMEADSRHMIDNMEALDIFTTAEGEIIIAIASDDNGSLWQRNLYLEFRLLAE